MSRLPWLNVMLICMSLNGPNGFTSSGAGFAKSQKLPGAVGDADIPDMPPLTREEIERAGAK